MSGEESIPSIPHNPSQELEESIELVDELLDFYMFPFTSHTSANIATWLVSILVAEDLPAKVWTGFTPDGAADGQKGITMVPGLAHKKDVCNLHDLQRTVLYSVGMAGSLSTRKNPDAKDMVRINGSTTKLQNQSREVNHGVKEVQQKAGIPHQKWIGGVRTNHTRWNNIKNQASRNNVMRPILTPVFQKYKREHATEVVLLELYTSDDDSDDEVPRGPYSVPARAVDRKKVGFTDAAWEANLEFEAFLTKPAEMKELIEKKKTITGAQSFQLHYNLQKSCAPTRPLLIQLFPESISVKDRTRAFATLPADKLLPLVIEGRKEMVLQLEKRFFSIMPSEARLVQIFISKQVPAEKILTPQWFQVAEAHYLKWMRDAAIILEVTTRVSPRLRAKKQRTSTGFFDAISDDNDDGDDDDTTHGIGSDPVLLEVSKWSALDPSLLEVYKDSDNLLDEFKMVFALRKQFPLHFTLFKQLAAHLPHEANAETTFSLSGRHLLLRGLGLGAVVKMHMQLVACLLMSFCVGGAVF